MMSNTLGSEQTQQRYKIMQLGIKSELNLLQPTYILSP